MLLDELPNAAALDRVALGANSDLIGVQERNRLAGQCLVDDLVRRPAPAEQCFGGAVEKAAEMSFLQPDLEPWPCWKT
jgi:hypothetical protein